MTGSEHTKSLNDDDRCLLCDSTFNHANSVPFGH